MNFTHRVEEVDEVAGDECEGARVDGVEVVAQGAVVAEGVAGKDEAQHTLLFSSLQSEPLSKLSRAGWTPQKSNKNRTREMAMTRPTSASD